jgi:hypothetical protein
MPRHGTCVLRQQDGQQLRDPHCTPGAINPAVTQATIGSMICVSGLDSTHLVAGHEGLPLIVDSPV